MRQLTENARLVDSELSALGILPSKLPNSDLIEVNYDMMNDTIH